MKVSIIVAADQKRGIGKTKLGVGKLLWDIPADLKRFRELTTGHPIIMGRKTFDSILSYRGKPLPNRTNIVVTRHPKALDTDFFDSYRSPSTSLVPLRKKMVSSLFSCSSVEEAIEKAKEIDNQEVFIIGGGQIYAQTIGLANRIYLTQVEGKYDADTFFPDYSDFKKVVSEETDEDNGYKFKWLTLERT